MLGFSTDVAQLFGNIGTKSLPESAIKRESMVICTDALPKSLFSAA
jgi:hypothetical protein